MRWESVKAGYELEFEDDFDGDTLDKRRWLPVTFDFGDAWPPPLARAGEEGRATPSMRGACRVFVRIGRG